MDKDFEENPVLIITVGGMLVMGVLTSVAAWLTTRSTVAIQWLVDHGILVPAEAAMIAVGDGGLDLARIVLILAAIALVLLVTVMIGMRIRTFRRRRALRELTM